MSEIKYYFLGQKNIIFIRATQCVRERERLFSKIFFWKTTYRK